MKLFSLLVIVSFAFGQLIAIPLGSNVVLYVHDILLACVIVFAIGTKKITPSGILVFPIGVFVGVAFISLLFNSYRFTIAELGVSSLYLLRWVLYSSLYVISLQKFITSRQWLTWTYWSGVCVAVLGFVQYVYYKDLRNVLYLGWDPHYYRIFSTFLDPNFLSLFLVLTLFLGMYFLNEKSRWPYMVGQFVTLGALFLTYSRSGYVALLVGSVVYALLIRRVKSLLIAICVFVVILFILPTPYGEGVKLLRTTSTFARVGNWQRGYSLIKESPIFGFGFNTLRYVKEARGWGDENSIIPDKAGAGLDDSFQFLWATTGIVGLVSYLWILSKIGKIFLRAQGNHTTRVLGVIGMSGLAATIVHSQFINSLFYPQILLWWWIVVGATEQCIKVDTSRDVRSSFGSPRGQSRRLSKHSRRRLRTSSI